MALLRDTRTAPPDGWRYVQFETGLELVGDSLDELADKIARHRKYKELERSSDLATIRLEIQRQICTGLSDVFCLCEDGEAPRRHVDDQSRHLTLAKIVAFSEGLIAFITTGGRMVTPSEAQGRGDICRGCRFNVHSRSCACGPFYRMLEAVIPKDRQQANLKICAACGCALQAKVNLPDSIVKASNHGRNLVFPDHCWQKEIA